ncbi:MAG: transposase [Clostridia bacterium]|nr:transposase [Clostridia bacterium]
MTIKCSAQDLSLLDKYIPLNGAVLHGYVLMPNHIHLILQAGARPLSKLMQVVQQTYTQGFNKRYERVGHVFQGRYKAFLIDEESYLLALIRYIHLNPVRANICATPEQYPWSSHHTTPPAKDRAVWRLPSLLPCCRPMEVLPSMTTSCFLRTYR